VAERISARRGGDGRFLDPWDTPDDRRGLRDFLRWRIARLGARLAPDPAPHELPLAEPAIVARAVGEARVTWVGHATFLLQLPGANILTDPVWSTRVSPLAWAGPARITPPGIAFDALPHIDAVVLSHDHYDHLDRPTVRRLHARYGAAVQWFVPLGHARWLRALGIERIIELDWWQDAWATTAAGTLRVAALPARHWTRRGPLGMNRRLWASFVLEAGGARLYFGGDTGYASFYEQIGRAHAPFHAALMPIGAYEPRWFMRPAHMTPEESVRAYQELGGTGLFTGMHWGTFRLADEPPLEPPLRARAAWHAAGLPADRLWIPQHGETRVIRLRA
jgi:N-acyl-phosphatidylethanolamine-hydrolysing phospholipase D